MFVHYFDPHFNYLEHPGYEYSEVEGRGGGRGFKSILALREAAKQDALSPSDLQRIKDHYDSEIRFTDAHIGRLFDTLKELGQYDQTMIIVTADHGEAFMDRPDRWLGHTVTLYQELIHVPLIIKLPGESRAKVIDEYVSTVDILPTIVEVAGIVEEENPSLRGRSLLLNLERRAVVSETRRGASLQAVASGGWKLILDTSSGKVSLFQLSDDPGERMDRADDLPEIVERLQILRRTWAARKSGRWDQGESVEPQLSPAELERLRGLGYVQ